MQLLDKLQYVSRLRPNATSSQPSAQELDDVLNYATDAWSEMFLKPRKLVSKDVAAVFDHGATRCFHLRAFARKEPDTFVIVLVERRKWIGHILIDLAAEYRPPILDCPFANYRDTPTAKELRKLISKIHPDMDEPFAIFNTGPGTYLQTYCGKDGFLLEYQLVNTSSHYEIDGRATQQQVISAMVSFLEGDHEWLNMFSWQRMHLPAG